jgi:hypothetical protein
MNPETAAMMQEGMLQFNLVKEQCRMSIPKENKKQMRVWWMPQVGYGTFYVPVESVEEAKKVMDLLSSYDCFQYNQNIKPDYCNCGGLQVYNEETEDWEDWYFEDDQNYFDDVDEYCESLSSRSKELEEFSQALFSQVEFN